jgi:multidrug transporter EmrE-like cation transporter
MDDVLDVAERFKNVAVQYPIFTAAGVVGLLIFLLYLIGSSSGSSGSSEGGFD